MTILDAEGRSRFAATCPDWDLDGENIRRTFILADFNEATGFVVRVAMLSEVADHHPDIDIRWNKVSITLTTHDQGGLTEKDAILAAAIDGLQRS
jgi:4a-hydroxytetrahydrobiopterin dehydratase